MPIEFVEDTAVCFSPHCDSDVGSAVGGEFVHFGGELDMGAADFGVGGAVSDDDGLGGRANEIGASIGKGFGVDAWYSACAWYDPSIFFNRIMVAFTI